MVAARIKAMRQSRGWSAKDLALRCAALGFDQLTSAVIANIETGRRDAEGRRRREVTVDELFAIALAFEVAPLELQLPLEAEVVAVTPAVNASRSDLASWLKGEINSISSALLRGLALCGSCRTALLVHGDSHDRTYFCANRSCPSPVIDISVEWADGLVSELALRILQQEDVIEVLFPDSGSGDSSESLDSRLAEMSTEIIKLRERRADAIRVLETLADSPEISADVVASSIASFDSKILELEQAIDELKKRLVLECSQGIVHDAWMAMPLVVRRIAIGILMAAVVITPESEIRVEWPGQKKAINPRVRSHAIGGVTIYELQNPFPQDEIETYVRAVNVYRLAGQPPHIVLGKVPGGDQYYGFYTTGGKLAVAKDLGTGLYAALVKLRDLQVRPT